MVLCCVSKSQCHLKYVLTESKIAEPLGHSINAFQSNATSKSAVKISLIIAITNYWTHKQFWINQVNLYLLKWYLNMHFSTKLINIYIYLKKNVTHLVYFHARFELNQYSWSRHANSISNWSVYFYRT